MRKIVVSLAILLMVAGTSTLQADDPCAGLIAGGVFETYATQSSQVSQAQFHQAMCHSELHVNGSSSNQSAGLSIGGIEIDLGMSMSAASQFQSRYRAEFCQQTDSGSLSQASLNVFHSVVSRDLVEGYNDCRRATQRGLQPEIRVLGDDSVSIDLTYTGAATPKVSTVTIQPSEQVSCVGQLVAGAELTTKTIGTICTRAQNYRGKMLISIETTEGRISKYLPPEPRPATQAELLRAALAQAVQSDSQPDGSGYLRVGGTLICWGKVTLPAARTRSFNFAFARPFKSPPVVTTGMNGKNSGYTYNVYSHDVTAERFDGTVLEARNSETQNEPLVMKYVAIGQAP